MVATSSFHYLLSFRHFWECHTINFQKPKNHSSILKYQDRRQHFMRGEELRGSIKISEGLLTEYWSPISLT